MSRQSSLDAKVEVGEGSPDVTSRPIRLLVQILLAMATLLLTGPLPAAKPESAQDDRVSRALEEGTKYLEAGEYSQAFKRFDEARAASKDGSAQAFLGLAEVEIARRKLDRALIHAEKALAVTHGPKSLAYVANFKGVIHFELFRQLGEKAFVRARKASGKPKPPFYDPFVPLEPGVGTSELEAQLAAAETSFRQALEQPDFATNVVRLNLALALEARGRKDEALQWAREFLDKASSEERTAEARAMVCWLERSSEPPLVASDTTIDQSRVTAPIKISDLPPEYPMRARIAKTQGRLVAKAIINEAGAVECARIASGLPNGLNESALAALEHWKFKPAKLDGEPIPVFYYLVVNFKLRR